MKLEAKKYHKPANFTVEQLFGQSLPHLPEKTKGIEKMHYMGQRLVMPLASLLLPRHTGAQDNFGVEPFVGGGNVINRVTGPRIARL